MEVYSLQPQPFLTNPSIPALFFRGVSTSNLPVVAKRYLCSALNHTTTISNVNTRIHEALFLAKIDHEHICKLLTAQFDIQSEAFSVTHIVEAADTDLRKEIDTRKRESRPFSEIELRQFLSQMAETLLFLHKKVTFRQGIAHRNLCPENILTDSAGSSYKLTGFSGHWEAAMPSTFQNVLEPGSHTCPELRQAFLGLKSNYNPFKSDVFALGATVLHMVNLTEPTELRSIGNLDAIVGGLLANIDCSEGLKALLSRMVTARDDSRILMHEVVEALAGLPQVRTGTAKSRSRKSKAKAAKSEQKQTNKPVQSSADVLRLPHVSDEEIRFFDEKRSDWGSAISLERAISCNLGSRYSLIDDDRIVTVGASKHY